MQSMRLCGVALILNICTFHSLGLASSIPAGQHVSRTQNPGRMDTNGGKSLLGAVIVGNADLVRSLIINGAAVNSYLPLHVAAMNNRSDIVTILLQNGANPNTIGSSILHTTSATGHTAVVKTILEHAQGLNINMPNADGLTAFHFAALNSHLDVMATLLEHGADCNSRTTDGSTALHSAAARGDLNTIQFILNLDQAILSAVNNDMQTPLGLARVNGHSSAASMISQKMGDVSTFNFARATTLPEVKALQRKGATDGPGGMVPDCEGFSLLHMAARNNYYDVLVYLVDHGASLNIANELHHHQTPLYEAAYWGNLGCVKYLVENGANMTMRGWGRNTPLQTAMHNNHQDVVNYLRAHGA